jgi:hypothetical protein
MLRLVLRQLLFRSAGTTARRLRCQRHDLVGLYDERGQKSTKPGRIGVRIHSGSPVRPNCFYFDLRLWQCVNVHITDGGIRDAQIVDSSEWNPPKRMRILIGQSLVNQRP